MKMFRLVGALSALAILNGTAVSAYTLEQAGKPAQTPPASYRGQTFVDSRGCAYSRIEVGTYVNWVPRLSADRQTVVCGLKPTDLAAAAAGMPAPLAPPSPSDVMAAPAETPAPDTSGNDAVSASRIASFADVAGGSAPVDEPAAPSAPAATTPSAPTVVRTVNVTCPAGGDTARVRVGADTVNVSCPAGQTSPIRYLVHHANGETSRVIASPAPAPTPAPVAAPEITIVDATTAPTAPSAPQSTARVRYGGVPVNSGTGNGFGSGYNTGSGPAPLDPTPSASQIANAPTNVTGGTITGSTASNAAGGATYPVGSGYGLTSSPGAADPVPAIPDGYRAAWSDGRLNPNRGPQSATGDAQMAAAWDTTQIPMRRHTTAGAATARSAPEVVSSMGQATASAAPATRAPAATGYRYVQVGAFRDAGNAAAIASKLQGLGLPGRVAKTRSGLNVVVAGPYDDSATLRNALAIARRGFPDAYLRN